MVNYPKTKLKTMSIYYLTTPTDQESEIVQMDGSGST